MSFVEVLEEILTDAPTAGESALVVLRSLAGHSYFSAVQALGRGLAREFGHPAAIPLLSRAGSLHDILAEEGIPPLLRIYLMSFSPRDLLAEHTTCSRLASDIRHGDDFPRFQRLVRRGAIVQHEALKAFVLCAFLEQYEMLTSKSMGGAVSSGAFLTMLDGILSDCRIVPGEAADMGFSFGRDLIVGLSGASAFLFIINHELGHHVFDAMLGRRTDGHATGEGEPIPPLGEATLTELAGVIPRLREGAIRLASQPIRPGDDRGARLGGGLSILYTCNEVPAGPYTHISFTNAGGPIDLPRASACAFFILSLLGVDPGLAATAYSPRGVFHFGFRGWGPDSEQLERAARDLDARSLASELPARRDCWLEGLAASDRIGRSEADVITGLGLAEPGPVYHGPEFEATWVDLGHCEQIRRGASLAGIDQQDRDRLLASAVRCADLAAARTMLAAGAAPGAAAVGDGPPIARAGASLCAVEHEGETKYFGPDVSSIFETIGLLASAGLDLNAQVDRDGNTLLIDAARRSPRFASFLLARGAAADPANAHGITPLHAAASDGPREVVESLLNSGAAANAGDERGRTALHAASARGDEAIVRILLARGADVDRADQQGETPLMVAGSAAVARLLCEAGADVEAASHHGQSALMEACARGLDDVVRVLIDAGADVGASNDLGEAAIHYAALCQGPGAQRACLEALIDGGAEVDAETNEGVTPLMVAARLAHLEALETLTARGAAVDARSATGNTAFIMAADVRQQWTRDFTRGLRTQEVFRLLARSGADVNAADDEGHTALHHAALGYDGSLLKTLLELGARADVRTSDGVTPIQEAAAQGHSFMVGALIEAGADVNAADRRGDTPLILALKNRPAAYGEIVGQLVRAGADTTLANSAGETPETLIEAGDADAEVRRVVMNAKAAATGR